MIPGVLCIASAIPLALLYHHLGRELRRAGSDLQDELRVVAAARRPQPPRPVAVSLWIDRTEGTQGVVASFVW